MGHCATWFAVAGQNAVMSERLWSLAGGDWTGFSPPEQAAFAFARKLVMTPSSMTNEDFQGLLGHLGEAHTHAIILWVGHCLTRGWVNDVFQLDPSDAPFLVSATRKAQDNQK